MDGRHTELVEADEQEQVTILGASSSSGLPEDSVPPRRGGIRQRLAAAMPAESEPELDLPFLDGLKDDGAKGKLSSGKLLMYAQKAITQGATGMGEIENLGGHNAFRSLKKLFGWPKGAPDFHWLEIPTTAGPKTTHPFIMPHEFFASYFAERKQDWRATATGPKGACKEFWTAMKDNIFVQRHPSLPEA